MSGQIEAWLWSSGDASSLDATATFSVTDTGGTDTFTLSGPMRFGAALTEWQTLVNDSATLDGAYAFTWEASNVPPVVKFEQTSGGGGTFTLAFAGNLHTALGFTSATGHTGAASYSSDATPLVRFDDIRVSLQLPQPGGEVALREYAHGRHRAIAFGTVDVWRARLYLRAAVVDSFLASYCAAGKIRLWCDDSNASAYAIDNIGGYVDGFVLGLVDQRDLQGKVWAAVELTLAYPRA